MSQLEMGLIFALAVTWIVGALFLKIACTMARDAERKADDLKYCADRATERSWEAVHSNIRLAVALGYEEKTRAAVTEFVKK